MSIETHARELQGILKREIRSFNTVSELLILEEKALVECDLDALSDVLEKQEDVFTSISCLEESRLQIIKRLAAETDMKEDEITITNLRSMVDEELSRELGETGHILEKLHENITKKKNTNAMLIKQGILLVENDLKLLLNAVGKKPEKTSVYSNKAHQEGLKGSVAIDGRM